MIMMVNSKTGSVVLSASIEFEFPLSEKEKKKGEVKKEIIFVTMVFVLVVMMEGDQIKVEEKKGN